MTSACCSWRSSLERHRARPRRRTPGSTALTSGVTNTYRVPSTAVMPLGSASRLAAPARFRTVQAARPPPFQRAHAALRAPSGTVQAARPHLGVPVACDRFHAPGPAPAPREPAGRPAQKLQQAAVTPKSPRCASGSVRDRAGRQAAAPPKSPRCASGSVRDRVGRRAAASPKSPRCASGSVRDRAGRQAAAPPKDPRCASGSVRDCAGRQAAPWSTGRLAAPARFRTVRAARPHLGVPVACDRFHAPGPAPAPREPAGRPAQSCSRPLPLQRAHAAHRARSGTVQARQAAAPPKSPRCALGSVRDRVGRRAAASPKSPRCASGSVRDRAGPPGRRPLQRAHAAHRARFGTVQAARPHLGVPVACDRFHAPGPAPVPREPVAHRHHDAMAPPRECEYLHFVAPTRGKGDRPTGSC
jgi:hypothetical protein